MHTEHTYIGSKSHVICIKYVTIPDIFVVFSLSFVCLFEHLFISKIIEENYVQTFTKYVKLVVDYASKES